MKKEQLKFELRLLQTRNDSIINLVEKNILPHLKQIVEDAKNQNKDLDTLKKKVDELKD